MNTLAWLFFNVPLFLMCLGFWVAFLLLGGNFAIGYAVRKREQMKGGGDRAFRRL